MYLLPEICISCFNAAKALHVIGTLLMNQQHHRVKYEPIYYNKRAKHFNESVSAKVLKKWQHLRSMYNRQEILNLWNFFWGMGDAVKVSGAILLTRCLRFFVLLAILSILCFPEQVWGALVGFRCWNLLDMLVQNFFGFFSTLGLKVENSDHRCWRCKKITVFYTIFVV